MQIGMVSSNFKRFFSLTREQGMPPWWREVCLWDLRCAECFVALLRLFSTFFIEQLLLLNRAVATVPSLVKIVWLLRLTKITLRARRTVSLSYLFPWLTVLQSQWQSGIREIFAFGIQNLGLWSLRYSSRNPEFHCRLKSEIHVHWQRIGNSVPGIRNPLRGIQNPKFPYRPLHGAAFY